MYRCCFVLSLLAAAWTATSTPIPSSAAALERVCLEQQSACLAGAFTKATCTAQFNECMQATGLERRESNQGDAQAQGQNSKQPSTSNSPPSDPTVSSPSTPKQGQVQPAPPDGASGDSDTNTNAPKEVDDPQSFGIDIIRSGGIINHLCGILGCFDKA